MTNYLLCNLEWQTPHFYESFEDFLKDTFIDPLPYEEAIYYLDENFDIFTVLDGKIIQITPRLFAEGAND